MSQAEPSAPLDPEPGRRTTTTATADAPTPVKADGSGPTTGVAPAAEPRVRITTSPPLAVPSDPAAGGSGTDAVHRRFWGEDEPGADGAGAKGRRRGRRARRQQWVVRNVSTWSVLKISVLFFACMWAVLLVAGVVLWEVGDQAGLIGNAESFWAEATGNEEVSWDGEVVFRSAVLAGGVLALASVAFAVLFAVLFNLICDMTGGIRLTVLQVEPKRPAGRRGDRSG